MGRTGPTTRHVTRPPFVTPPTWLSGYARGDFRNDLVAGLTLAGVLVPSAMAFAHVAGLPPHVGLASAIVPVLLYAVFGMVGSMSLGPIGSASLLTGIVLGRHGPGTDDLAVAALVAFLAGVLFLLVALLGADPLVRRVSPAAMAGSCRRAGS